ncbi:MAG: tetratricopeptide repeat protein [Chloroflexi bacterium]|nr:tetratricopeptide repeat protein [Chloroflexota bacterium]
MLLYLLLNLAALAFARQVFAGQVTLDTFVHPTPTPTRAPQSWVAEARALFEAGDLEGAAEAYREALKIRPDDGLLWAELARVLVYSSALMTDDTERHARLQEAVAAADRAVEHAPDSAVTHAVRSFALDWLALNPLIPTDQQDALLAQAENEAAIALRLGPNDPLTLAFYAEILLDQKNIVQAYEYATKAVQEGPDLMDTHRVYALVLESNGRYASAIEEYLAAIQRAPNLTFLYLRVGFNYRFLASKAQSDAARRQYYGLALEYFDKAARINQRLGIPDPVPYIAISKTYVQQGDFFAAALNAEKALWLDPTDPATYAQLAVIYVKSRNYEGSLPAFQCAVKGCGPEVSGQILGEIATKMGLDKDAVPTVTVEPLPLTNITVAYYYLQYASVLAALNICDQALPLLDQVESAFGTDPNVRGIIAENRNICRILQATPTPVRTPTPTPTRPPTQGHGPGP